MVLEKFQGNCLICGARRGCCSRGRREDRREAAFLLVLVLPPAPTSPTPDHWDPEPSSVLSARTLLTGLTLGRCVDSGTPAHRPTVLPPSVAGTAPAQSWEGLAKLPQPTRARDRLGSTPGRSGGKNLLEEAGVVAFLPLEVAVDHA